jgi:protease I
MEVAMKLEAKKILMIIAPEKFRDEEFEVPYKTFMDEGADVTVASLRKGVATGMFGSQFEVNTTLDEVNEKDFDAVVFVGGAGVPEVRADNRAVEIARNSKDHKVLSAICWAPTILAKAGVVSGKKTTVWLGDDPEYGKKTSDVMEDSGAQFINENVVTDGNIVTGNGPHAAQEFADAVIKKLTE